MVPNTLKEMVQQDNHVQRLRGGSDSEVVANEDTADIIQTKSADLDECQITFPTEVEEIEIPLPGLRPGVIRENQRQIEKLNAETKMLCIQLCTIHYTWQKQCSEQIEHYLVRAKRLYRSPEKRKIVEHLTILWLSEWKRRLLLRTTCTLTDNTTLGESISHTIHRHLDIDSHSLRHAFRGANTFRQLMIVLFATEPEDILAAKLDLLATSDGACVKYSRTQILHSFLQICQACNITADELVSYSTTVLTAAQSNCACRKCICGQPITNIQQWNLHHCIFERWLIDLSSVEIRNTRMFTKRNISWSNIISQCTDQYASHFPYLEISRSVSLASTASGTSEQNTDSTEKT